MRDDRANDGPAKPVAALARFATRRHATTGEAAVGLAAAVQGVAGARSGFVVLLGATGPHCFAASRPDGCTREDPALAAILPASTVAVADAVADPGPDPFRPPFVDARAWVAAPVRDAGGRAFAVVGVADPAPLPRAQAATDLLTVAAGVAASALARPEQPGRPAEDAPGEAESFRSLVEQIPAVAYTLEVRDRTRLTYVSPRSLDILGYRPEEMLAEEGFILARAHPDDRRRILEAEARAAETGERYATEYRFRAGDGRWLWVREEALLTGRAPDGAERWQGVFLDITARKAAEAERQAAEEQFRRIVEQVPSIAYTLDPTGDRFTYVSPQVTTLLGWTPEEVLAESDFMLKRMLPEDRDRSAAGQSAGDRERMQGSYRVRAKDGRVVWMQSDAQRIRDADGTPAGWQGTLIDITAEQQAREALAAAERDYRALVEQLPGIVFRRELGARAVAYVSPQMTEVLGWTPEEVVADENLLATLIHPDDFPGVAASDAKANRTGEPYTVEYRMRAKDGRWVWLRITAHLVRGASGPPVWQGIALDVSAEKAAEAALRTREERFRALVQNAADPVVVTDRDGRVVDATPAFERHLGYSPAQLQADRSMIAPHPDDVARVSEAFGRVVAEPDRAETVEVRLRRADGAWVWTELLMHNLLDNPAVGGVVVNGRDIHDRKVAELALTAERDLLDGLLNAVPDPIVIRDAEGRYLRANPAAVASLGAPSLEAVIGSRLDDWFPPAEAALRNADDRHVLESGETLTGIRYASPGPGNDPGVELLATKVPLRGADGSPVAVVSVSRDVTPLRQAEEAAIRERDRLQQIIDRAPDLVVLKDRDLRFVMVNRAAADLLGLADPADAVGKRSRDVRPAALAPHIERQEQAVLDRGAAAAEQIEAAVDASGAQRWFLTARTPLFGRDGAVDGVLSYSRDITDLHRSQEEMTAALRTQQAANRELQRLNAAKSHFITVVSHEFRTPLTSIQGFSELIRDLPLPEEEVRESADVIQRSATRLARLIDELLDLSQMEAGKATLDRQPVPLNDVAREVVGQIGPVSPAHRFILDLDPSLPPVPGDRDRLTQVLTNLVGNAVKYSPQGGPVWVTSRHDHEHDTARLSVRDAGTGIAPEAIGLIFEPYVRVDAGGRARPAGTGLGLAISRDIVALHGGRITVESMLGNGSLFVVELPLGDGAPGAVEATRTGGTG